MSFMSNFFEKSDLSRKEAESIISDTLQKNVMTVNYIWKIQDLSRYY